MLKALGSQLQRQQAWPTSLLPSVQAAGFAKKKGKDDDSGPDPKINRLLKASSMPVSSMMHLRRSHLKEAAVMAAPTSWLSKELKKCSWWKA